MEYQPYTSQMSQKDQTAMWMHNQNNHYHDSDIHSTATSYRGGMNFDQQPGSSIDYTQEQIDNMNQQLSSTRAQRIRAAMFPETLEDPAMDIPPSTQYITGLPTAVQKLSEPSQQLKNAVVDIINYKEDAEITEKAIPELIRLLNDEDPIVVGQTALVIHTLAKKEASRLALTNPQLIHALIHAVSNPKANAETKRGVAGIFQCLAQQKQGLFCIFKSGGIPALVKLLDSPIETVVNYAISTLHSLLLYIEQAKMEILRCGGCHKMVSLLTSSNPKFLAIVTDCLYMLAFNNQEVKLIIESSNGPPQLLQIMELTDYEKLLWTTTRLLRVLSVGTSIKGLIIQKNGIKIFEKYVCNAISEGMETLLHKLIQLLSSTDFVIVSCAVGVLSNLTCNNQFNKMAVVQYNGVNTLINTIVQAEDKEEIIEPAICALRHITSRHPHASDAQNTVRDINGISIIVELLNPSRYSWPIIKSTISLIRNLALSPNNLSALRENDAIPKLAQLLIRSHQELQRQASKMDSNNNNIGFSDILEASIGALHIIAKDPSNRIIIRDLDCIPLFVRLLYLPSVSIQRAAAGVLCELVNDRICAEIIE
ncbi:unnamed protein product, partial [Didymodactylos carnosus]